MIDEPMLGMETVKGAGMDKYPGLNQYSVNSMEAMGYTKE